MVWFSAFYPALITLFLGSQIFDLIWYGFVATDFIYIDVVYQCSMGFNKTIHPDSAGSRFVNCIKPVWYSLIAVFVLRRLELASLVGRILAGHYYVNTVESHGLRQKKRAQQRKKISAETDSHLALCGSLIITARHSRFISIHWGFLISEVNGNYSRTWRYPTNTSLSMV